MKKKLVKKVLSSVLAAALAMSLLPVSALAATDATISTQDDTYYVMMNVPYADFYAAVLGDEYVSTGFAVSSEADADEITDSTLSAGTYYEGTTVKGVTVGVKMDADVFTYVTGTLGYKVITAATTATVTYDDNGTTKSKTVYGADALCQQGDYAMYVATADVTYLELKASSYYDSNSTKIKSVAFEKALTVDGTNFKDYTVSVGKLTTTYNIYGYSKGKVISYTFSEDSDYGTYQVSFDSLASDVTVYGASAVVTYQKAYTDSDSTYTVYEEYAMRNLTEIRQDGASTIIAWGGYDSAYYGAMEGTELVGLYVYTDAGVYWARIWNSGSKCIESTLLRYTADTSKMILSIGGDESESYTIDTLTALQAGNKDSQTSTSRLVVKVTGLPSDFLPKITVDENAKAFSIDSSYSGSTVGSESSAYITIDSSKLAVGSVTFTIEDNSGKYKDVTIKKYVTSTASPVGFNSSTFRLAQSSTALATEVSYVNDYLDNISSLEINGVTYYLADSTSLAAGSYVASGLLSTRDSSNSYRQLNVATTYTVKGDTTGATPYVLTEAGDYTVTVNSDGFPSITFTMTVYAPTITVEADTMYLTSLTTGTGTNKTDLVIQQTITATGATNSTITQSLKSLSSSEAVIKSQTLTSAGTNKYTLKVSAQAYGKSSVTIIATAPTTDVNYIVATKEITVYAQTAATLSLKKSAVSVTYTGEAPELTGYIVGDAYGEATVVLYTDEACTTKATSYDAGTYYAKAETDGTGYYLKSVSSDTMTVKIKKASQSVSIKKIAKKIKAGKTKAMISVSGNEGTLTYKITNSTAGKKIKINKETGEITVKKGTAAGTYKVTIKVKSAKTANYKKATVTKTITIKVK